MSEWTQALRRHVCEALNYLGARIDEAAKLTANGESIAAIHAGNSSVEIWVVPTDEGRVATQDAARLIDN